MPTLVSDSVLLTVAMLLVSVPISLFHLVRLLRRQEIDVINCHYLMEHYVHLVVAARLTGVRVVISVHGADVDRYAHVSRVQRFLLRLVMRGATRIVACSEAMARQTREVFPAVGRKVTHVHKGIDTLLRAFALLEGDFPDLTLVLIGGGREIEKNRALARALGLEARVAFIGGIEHARILPYFASCALFVVPLRAEPFGLVVLEAAYYKKGIVATRVGGIPEIVTDDVSALLVDADDHVGMSAKMARLLRDPDLAGRLGARAPQVLTARFQWEQRVKDYITVYEGAGAVAPAAFDEAAVSETSSRATTTARR